MLAGNWVDVGLTRSTISPMLHPFYPVKRARKSRPHDIGLSVVRTVHRPYSCSKWTIQFCSKATSIISFRIWVLPLFACSLLILCLVGGDLSQTRWGIRALFLINWDLCAMSHKQEHKLQMQHPRDVVVEHLASSLKPKVRFPAKMIKVAGVTSQVARILYGRLHTAYNISHQTQRHFVINLARCLKNASSFIFSKHRRTLLIPQSNRPSECPAIDEVTSTALGWLVDEN